MGTERFPLFSRSATGIHSRRVLAALGLLGALALVVPCPLKAQVFDGISLRIPNETAPPGGTIQMKVMLTEPKPIITGMGELDYGTGPLGEVQGVALFNASSGDVSGAAVLNGGHLRVRCNSPGGSYGTDFEIPIIAVTIAVRPDANPGEQAPLTLDPNGSWWLDLLGEPYAQELQPGVFTVSGNLSISHVVPGSASLPIGSRVTVHGTGFEPQTRVWIEGVALASTQFVSPSQMEVVLAEPVTMHGKRVRVRNRDRSQVFYYSYQRTARLGQSARALLAATVPIFSTQTFPVAYFDPVVDSGLFFGLGFQNQSAQPSDITVELYSPDGDLLGRAALSLPQDRWIAREFSELLSDVVPPAGSFLRVVSSVPVQMLGLIGDEAGGTVAPVEPAPAR